VWHPDPDQLTLAALPAEPSDPRVSAHLGECRLCRGQVDSLRRTVELAQDGADGVDDDGGPPDRVWRAIADELALGAPTGGTGPRPVPPVVVLPPAERRSRWRRMAVPVAAAVLGVLSGAAIGYGLPAATPGGSAPPPAAVAVPLSPVGDLDPAGAGRAEMVSDGPEERMRVTITGVDDLAGGDYLQVWLLDPVAARLVALGGLSPVPGEDGAYRGTFTLPAGIPLAEYPVVDVSAERWDGDPGHSSLSVLRGDLA
jgi:anti-sigma-K factor RskA